jgi:NAD(P)-dependent dehydrogenase (short-subunit alcohol dehydrogenase family)
VASVAGVRGERYVAAYSASKHAVLGLTRSAAEELRGTGVTVNAVCPGYVDTPMTERSISNVAEKTGSSPEAALARMLDAAGQARLLTADEVAAAVLSLCGEVADTWTGLALVFGPDGEFRPLPS